MFWSLVLAFAINILLLNGITMFITILSLFIASCGVLVVYFINDAMRLSIDRYLKWISTLFLHSSIPDIQNELITFAVIMITSSLVMCLFSAKYLNTGAILFLIVPFAVFNDLSGNILGANYFILLVFAFSLYYMRSRQAYYLERRDNEITDIHWGTRPSIIAYPMPLIAFLLTVIVFSIPVGLYTGSKTDSGISSYLADTLRSMEKAIYDSQKVIIYENDKVGRDEGENSGFAAGRIKVLSAESYSPAIEYLYIRGYSYTEYDGGWKFKKTEALEPDDSKSAYMNDISELKAAIKLLDYRRIFGPRENRNNIKNMINLFSDVSVKISYDNINANTVFGIPHTLGNTITENARNDIYSLNGTGGLYSEKDLGDSISYNIEFISIERNNNTADLYRYFGDGFYNRLTDKEIIHVYNKDVSGYVGYSDSVARIFGTNRGITPDMKTLAVSLTENADTTFDKAVSIAGYLLENYKYDKDSIIPVDGSDFVSEFLFKTKKGTSAEFASAAVLLLRAAGIPARYNEGYLALSGGKIGEVAVKEKDEHAWAEYYLEGFGWVVLETTPGKGVPATDLISDVQTKLNAPLTIGDILGPKAILKYAGTAFYILIRISVVILLLAAAYIALREVQYALTVIRIGKLKGKDKYFGIFGFLLRGAEGAGYKRGCGESILEYTGRLDKVLSGQYKLYSLAEDGYAVKYGNKELPSESYKRLKEIYNDYNGFLRSLGVTKFRIFTGKYLKGNL